MNRIAKMVVMDDKQRRARQNDRSRADYDRYEAEDRSPDRRDRDRRDTGRFSVAGEMDWTPGSRSRRNWDREDDDRRDRKMDRGPAHKAGGMMRLDKQTAKEWTEAMENGDGTRGPHWTVEQTDQVMAQRGLECDSAEFFAVLNSVYSDYCAVAQKHGVNNVDFYADLAKAWLHDKDAVKDKAAAYYEYIVKH